MTSTESRSTRCVRSGGAWVEHHQVDLVAQLGFELRAEIETERFKGATAGRRFQQHCNVKIAAGPRFASRNAAEEIDCGDALFTATEGLPEPFDRTLCVHDPDHARGGAALHPSSRTAGRQTARSRTPPTRTAFAGGCSRDRFPQVRWRAPPLTLGPNAAVTTACSARAFERPGSAVRTPFGGLVHTLRWFGSHPTHRGSPGLCSRHAPESDSHAHIESRRRLRQGTRPQTSPRVRYGCKQRCISPPPCDSAADRAGHARRRHREVNGETETLVDDFPVERHATAFQLRDGGLNVLAVERNVVGAGRLGRARPARPTGARPCPPPADRR